MYIPTTQLAQGGGGAGLLAAMSYAPGSDTTIGTVASSTLGDFDATNVKVTFTAPASGNVVVQLFGLAGGDVTPRQISFGVREGGSIVAGPSIVDVVANSAGAGYTASFYITGVSAGSHTYKFAGSSGAGSVSLYGGPVFGQVVMAVWASP